jgi:hypothetical protein
MSKHRGALPAAEVHRRLQSALIALERAEQNAVLWFSEVYHRKLHRELGYASIQQYAMEALGFSRAKTAQFLRLSESFQKLPRLRDSLASGELPWTKAREVVKIATPRSQSRWIAAAKTSSRRELEATIRRARLRAKAARCSDPRQGVLPMLQGGNPTSTREQASGHGSATRPPAVPPAGTLPPTEPTHAADPTETDVLEVPVELRLTFTPEQYARYEALMERVRKRRIQGSREELLLEGLESLLQDEPRSFREASHRGSSPRHTNDVDRGTHRGQRATTRCARHSAPDTRVPSASPYQIVTYICSRCGNGELNTSRGRKPIARATLEMILCDARVARDGKRNTSTVPPRLRRAVFERDGHRCRLASCSHTRFLTVHHVVPRECNGPNSMSNLITVCAACHHLLHERERRMFDALLSRMVLPDVRLAGVPPAGGRVPAPTRPPRGI